MTNKIRLTIIGLVLLGTSGCQNMLYSSQQPNEKIAQTRYCRAGNGVVFRTTEAQNVDPIRVLKDSEHGCR